MKTQRIGYFVSLCLITLMFFSFQGTFSTSSAGEIGTDAISSTGFMRPTETLLSSEWGNGTNNPLGGSEGDATYTSSTASTNYAKGINYNFDIPTDSQILGIEVMIEHATWNGNTGYYATISVELEWNLRTQATNTGIQDTVNDQYSGWNDNFKNVTLGASDYTWGRTWSAEDFNNDNFAVKVSLIDLLTDSESLDIVWVNVRYDTPPVPASIDLNNSGDVTYDDSNISEFYIFWEIEFFFGDVIDLDNYLEYMVTIGTTSYEIDGVSTLLNNSVLSISPTTQFYLTDGTTYIGTFIDILSEYGTYEFTLSVTLNDILAIPAVTASSSITVTYEKVVGDPYFEFDNEEINLVFLEGEFNSDIGVLATLLNASNINITDYYVYVFLNDNFLFSQQFLNNTLGFYDLNDYTNGVGMYYFTLIFEATWDSGNYVNASVPVYVDIVDAFGVPYLELSEDLLEFDITLEELQNIEFDVLPVIMNATGINFEFLEVDIYLNEDYIESYSFLNNTVFSYNVSELINEVGFYQIELEFLTSYNGNTISESLFINLNITSGLNNSSTSLGLPELTLDFPIFGVFMSFIGFITLYQRRKYN